MNGLGTFWNVSEQLRTLRNVKKSPKFLLPTLPTPDACRRPRAGPDTKKAVDGIQIALPGARSGVSKHSCFGTQVI
jgi:hypothetical protein